MPRSREEIREYHRIYQREYRARLQANNPPRPRGRPRLYDVGPIGSAGNIPSVTVPEEVARKVQQKAQAFYRSQIGALMGDPPVGYSALDRRETNHETNKA